MKTVSPQIIEEIDRRAIEDFLIPRLVLMENAGRLVAEESLISFKPKRVILFCGAGYNGGDGLVAARYLLERVGDLTVVLVSEESKLKAETKTNLEILKKLKVNIVSLDSLEKLGDSRLEESDLIIDAIIGIGLKSEIRSPLGEIIDKINKEKARIVSVDIPSGLSAFDGSVSGACIKADLTVTFALAKDGMRLAQGPNYCGKVKIVDIGIPQQVVKEVC